MPPPVRVRTRSHAVILATVAMVAGITPAEEPGESMLLRVRVLDERGKQREDATADAGRESGELSATGRWNGSAGVCEIHVPQRPSPSRWIRDHHALRQQV